MEFRQLKYFAVTAECKNLSQAAGRLHIAQSALSHSIKKLEDELDLQLFIRNSRGVELTEAGATFLEHSHVILQQIDKAKFAAQEAIDNPIGVVRIAMVVSAGTVLTVPTFQLLTAKYPNIHLFQDEGLSGGLMQQLEAGLLDLMIETDAVEAKHLRTEPLIREHLYLVTPYSSAPEASADIDFNDLVNYDLFVPGLQHGMGRTLRRYADEAGIELKHIHHVASARATLQLVQAGIGYVTMPWSAIHEMVEMKCLCARKIINPNIRRTISIITPLARPRSHATNKVEEVIRTAVKQVHAEGKWHGELLI